VRLTSALKYNFAIGETRRVAADRDVFKSTALTVDFSGKPLTFSVFDKVTCIFGGPIRGGWLSLRDFGGWRFRVNQVHSAPNYVQMKLLALSIRRSPSTERSRRCRLAIVDAMTAERARTTASRPVESLDDPRLLPGDHLSRAVDNGDARRKLHAAVRAVHPDKATAPDIFTRNGEASIWVDWTAAAPAVGDQYDVYMYPTDISEDNPLHIFEHPVDLIQKLATSRHRLRLERARGVRSAIGDELRLALRITKSPGKLKDFEADAKRPLRNRFRSDGQGREVEFSHRIKLSTYSGATSRSTISATRVARLRARRGDGHQQGDDQTEAALPSPCDRRSDRRRNHRRRPGDHRQ
jgi:hypothetical protein